MADVKPIPEGREGLIAHFVVSDAKKAIEYYEKAFGAEILGVFPAPDGRVMHAELMIAGSVIYLSDDFPEMMDGKSYTPEAMGGSPVGMSLYVEDVDAAMAKAEAAGGKITMPAEDMYWGDRFGKVEDPFGHTWSFATHIKEMTPEEMDAARDTALDAG